MDFIFMCLTYFHSFLFFFESVTNANKYMDRIDEKKKITQILTDFHVLLFLCVCVCVCVGDGSYDEHNEHKRNS